MEFTLGLAAGVITLAAFIPYILDTLSGKAKPNRASWIVWAVLGVIITASYYSIGARETMWLPIATMLGQIAVALLSLKYGSGGWTKLERACLAGGALGLVLWAIFNSPITALVLTVLIDVAGSMPTLRKAYFRPESESLLTWVMLLAANVFNVAALPEWTLGLALYPVYLLVLSAVIITLMFWPR